MHLKIYGTAAAEGIPGMFCTCPVCAKARKLGGREIRTRSQALVDGRLLIDFPPDTYLHVLRDGLDLPSITALLLTHSHEDHLYASDFENRKPGFAHAGQLDVPLREPLRVYASSKAMEAVRTEHFMAEMEANRVIELHEIKAFEPFEVDDFKVTAVTANHNPATGPVCWVIERGGKTMLYGNDTGYFPDETWAYFAHAKPQFDFVSLDCTYMGIPSKRDGHMGLDINAEVRDRLQQLGCVNDNTVVCAHHFSHNGGFNHEELCAEAAKHGMIASYDGMEISF